METVTTLEPETTVTPEQAEAELRTALGAPAKEATPEPKAEPVAAAATTEVKAGEPNKPADTQATTEKKDNRSEYAKSQERLEKTWTSVNERKTQLDAREQQLKDKELAIQRQEQSWQEKQAKSSNRFTPEQYETASNNNIEEARKLDLQAKGLDKQAEEFEEDGKYTEAQSAKERAKEFRENAAFFRGKARECKDYANHLRQNPDPTAEQLRAKTQGQLQQYTLEAAKKYPELVKEGSEFQKVVVQKIQLARNAGLDENDIPYVRYLCAEWAGLESAAARVPELEKKLGTAEAKVKELEALNAPGGGTGSAQNTVTAETPFSQMTLEQQEQWLRNNSK